MENCPKCGSILKCKQGKYSSSVGTDKVIFKQTMICDNKQCTNNKMVLKTIEHKVN